MFSFEASSNSVMPSFRAISVIGGVSIAASALLVSTAAMRFD